MVDKRLSNSSFLALRFTEIPDVDFTNCLKYRRPEMPSDEGRILVHSAKEIGEALRKQIEEKVKDYKKVGIFLSGGMDSSILASYLPGIDAYTFRFLGGDYQKDELQRAEQFAKQNRMNLHYVDIDWKTVVDNLKLVMLSKGGPVHSIEPQICQGARQAKADGVDLMIIGDASDYIFGGMDKLLSKDWLFEDFYHRYIYVEPEEILKEPVSIRYLFERYRKGSGIDFVEILDKLATQESYGSYDNAFRTAGLDYFDPYEKLKMADPLDLTRIRNGESKYLIRELFKMRYPETPVPEKIPMPRPVDTYFAHWDGPTRPEFRKDIDISRYSGNQKWLIWCLEQFLNMVDEMEDDSEMIDKKYCMSSYMAFRYIEKDGVDFYKDGGVHKNIVPIPDDQRILVHTSDDIDREIGKQMEQFKDKKKGILLSGGMDSAIVASYLRGSDAYTFRFLSGEYQKEELERAEYYAKYYGLNLHYVDISWDTVVSHLEPVMKAKAAPVHSIEPQILQAALQAKADGVEVMFVGESSDLIFGGMDGLLSKDWTLEEFMDRYIFLKPEEVLIDPESMRYLFERYRIDGDKIDFLRFMDDVFSIESSSSYMNAFAVAEMPYYDPYARLKMADPLDLYRVRHGEPKYLIRELMAKKYPEIPVPNKVPMPRPVDTYFKTWEGPKRPEFRSDIDMNKFSGNQKWQMYCLEKFLEMNEG